MRAGSAGIRVGAGGLGYGDDREEPDSQEQVRDFRIRKARGTAESIESPMRPNSIVTFRESEKELSSVPLSNKAMPIPRDDFTRDFAHRVRAYPADERICKLAPIPPAQRLVGHPHGGPAAVRRTVPTRKSG